MACWRVAWCPGGRTAQNAACASPADSASAARSTPPAPRRQASHEASLVPVSGSSQPPPSSSEMRSSSSRYSAGCTRSSSSRVAGRGSIGTRASATGVWWAPWSTASSRAGRSGWFGEAT